MDRRTAFLRLLCGGLLTAPLAAAEAPTAPAPIASAATAPVPTPPAPTAPAKKPKIRWLRDLHTAHQAALKTGKPLMLVFGASWCNHCRQLDLKTLRHPQLVNYINRTFIPVVLILDRNQREADILDVKSVPCTIVLTPDGDLIGRMTGYVEAPRFYAALKQARKLQTRIETAGYEAPASAGGEHDRAPDCPR